MPTRLGFRFFLAAFLTFAGAAISASNLLYLVDGMLAAALIVGWVFGRANLRGLRVEAAFPDHTFQGTSFELSLTLTKAKGRTAHQISIVAPAARAFVAVVRKNAPATAVVPYAFPRRGRNRVVDLRVESSFPFGLFVHRRKVEPAEGLAFPRVFEIFGRQTSPAVREEQVSLPHRGVGEDFYGLRVYGEGEDSRLICWKLSAKTGTPLIKEYAQQVGNRVTITVTEVTGRAAERRLSEAASLAKFFIDSGADVRLETPETNVDFGHGLLHLHLLLETLALAGDGRTARDSDAPPAKTRFEAFPVRNGPPRLAYLTTFIAFASLLLIEEIHPLLLMAFLPVFIAGFLFDRARRYPVPKPLLEGSAAAFLLYFLFVDLPAAGALRSVVHLVLFILLYLLLSPKTSRVLGQLFVAAFLAFALTSGQALSLWYFVFFVAFFASAGAWLIRHQDPLPAPRRPAWMGALAAATLLAVVLSGLAFIVLPRPYSARMQQLLAGTGFTRLSTSLRTFAGLAERVELGYFGPLNKNTARVMRVSLEGMTDANRPPYIRVRGTTFGVFDGKRWYRTYPEFTYRSGDRILRARHAQAWMRRERRILYAPQYDPERPVRREDIVLSPLLNTNIIFSVGSIEGLETDFPGAYYDSTDTAFFSSVFPEGMHYTVLSQNAETSFYRQIEHYDDLLQNKYLKLSVSFARFRQLAEDVTGRAADREGKTRALEAHLRTNYAYSLAPALGRQSVEAFLFDNRAGNCEYFATAMVLLLRQIGIPARLVVGFLSAEWNSYGLFFDVRQSDAHAWVEAYLPSKGWTTFDPTPPDFTQGGRRTILARLWSTVGQYFDSVQYRWYRYVIGYDTFTQRNFLFHFQAAWTKSILKILAVLALVSAAAVLVWTEKPWRLRRRRTRGRPSSGDFFERAVDRLGRSGFLRRPAETAVEFASGLARDHPELGAIAPLAAFHYEHRYAGRGLTPAELDDVGRLAARLEEGLRLVKKKRPPRLASRGRPR